MQPIDELALTELVRQGLHIDAVPEAGRFVALRRIESTAWDGVDEDVTATIHPENLRAALAPDGLLWPMVVDALHARVWALVLLHQVGALVIVVQTDELVDRDLPLKTVDAVHLANEKWIGCQPKAALQRKRELLRLLQAWQSV